MAHSKKNSVPVVIEHDIRMKKSINLLHCVSILCSVTGHISVFVAPTAMLRYTGSFGLSLLMWLLGGVMNLLLALCFTELAIMYPKAGGPYAYVLKVFGPLPGFMIMWGYLVLISGPFWAVLSYTAAIYCIQPFFINCQPPDIAVKLLAVLIILTFVFINCVYVKLVAQVQTLLSLSKVLALLLIIVAGLFSLFKDGSENVNNIWEDTVDDPLKVSMAFFFSVFNYGGWQIVVNLIEEVKNPGNDLPRAVYISLSINTCLFVLVNFAYYVVLSRQEIVGTTVVAVLFFEKFYPPLKAVISILVSLTAIGALNASILGHSRILFAGSRNDQTCVIFSMISVRFYTPVPAIIVLTIWAMIMLLSGGVFTLVEFVSLFSILMSLSVVVTLLYLRWTEPNVPRPYKTFLFTPVSQLILVVVVITMSVIQEPQKIGRGLLIVAAGVPVYVVGVLWKSKPKSYYNFINYMTTIVQKILLVRKSA